MYTISPLYQIIHFNKSTWYLKPLNIKWDLIHSEIKQQPISVCVAEVLNQFV